MGEVWKHILIVAAVMLGAFVGAVTGLFLGFFVVLNLRLAGILEMRELTIWPDYVILILGIIIGILYGGWLTWRGLR